MAEGNVFAPTDQVVHDSDLAPEEQIKRYLGQTRPWIGLLTVVMGLATAFMMCSGVVMQVSVSSVGAAFPAEEFGPFGAVMRYIGLIYVLIAVVYAIPMVLLGRYTLAAGATDLHQAALAVKYQRDFWRAVGILTLAIMGLYCAGLGAVMALAPR